MQTTMTTMVSSGFLFPIKEKTIFSAQDSLKPFILRTKREPSTGNFLHRKKLHVPTFLCRSGDEFSGDEFTGDSHYMSSFEKYVRFGYRAKAKEWTGLVDEGTKIANEIRNYISSKVLEINSVTGEVPCLAIVHCGKDPWKSFVEKLVQACKDTGISYVTFEMQEGYTKEELADVLSKFNQDSRVHAIHVQDSDDTSFLDRVNPEKDIDWYRSTCISDLLADDKDHMFIPPPAKGTLEVLQRSVKDLKYKGIVVVGKSVSLYQTFFFLKSQGFPAYYVHPFGPNYGMRKAMESIGVIKRAQILIHESGFQLKKRWLKSQIVLEVGRCPENSVSVEMNITMILMNTLDAAAKQIFG